MNDWQVRQIVLAIRAHARAMVAERLWAQAEAGTDVNHVVADADALLAALSASSGGEHGGAGIPGGGKPEHAAGPGDELTATPPLSADLVTARARIADLEEAARRYFNADGSVSLMVSAEAVVEARKAAALRIAELEAQVRERDGLLRQVLDPDDCRLDHHGFCQTHGWMDRSGCPHARIRSLIGGAK